MIHQIWLFENIADRSQYKFGGKLTLFMRFGTFSMMKAKQDKMKCLFWLYSFNLNLNHREVWSPKWRLNQNIFNCQGENVSRIDDRISCTFKPCRHCSQASDCRIPISMVVHITYLHCQSSEDSPGSRGTYAPSQNSLLNMIHCCLLSLTRFLSWEWSFLPPWCCTWQSTCTKKVSLKACHSSKLELACTSPRVFLF